MTVEELIKELNKLEGNLKVYVDDSSYGECEVEDLIKINNGEGKVFIV